MRRPIKIILITLAVLGIVGGILVIRRMTAPSGSSAAPYVLRLDEGEVLERGENNSIAIKVDPKTGSPGMALGTQTLGDKAAIPLHIHEEEDEVLFVHAGSGMATIGESQTSLGIGDTIYVPHGTWHALAPGEQGVTVLWVVTPPGLEDFFREISTPRGAAKRPLTPEQINDIAKKHGVQFKPQK